MRYEYLCNVYEKIHEEKNALVDNRKPAELCEACAESIKRKGKAELKSLKDIASKSFSLIEVFLSKANEANGVPPKEKCENLWRNFRTEVSPEEVYCVLFYCISLGYLNKRQHHEFILKTYELAGYTDEAKFLRWVFFLGDSLAQTDPHSGEMSVSRDEKLKNKLIAVFQGARKKDVGDNIKYDSVKISALMNTESLVTANINYIFHFMERDCRSRDKREITILRFIRDRIEKGSICYVKRILCYYFYFYAVEANVAMPRGNNTAYFSDLFRKAGHDPGIDTWEHMEDVVTYYEVKNGHHAEQWKKELIIWNEKSENSGARLKKPENMQTKYQSWYNAVMMPGFDEKKEGEVTQDTVAEIDRWKDGAEGIDPNMISVILDTELRRHWYFCRLLQLIMEKRINDNGTLKAIGKQGFCVHLEWIRKSKENKIVVNQIASTFNYAFDGSGNDDTGNDERRVAFAPLNERLYNYRMLAEVRGEKEAKRYESREKMSDLRPCAKILDSLIFYKHDRKVGRNLLLLTSLLAKAYDVGVGNGREFSLEYVKEHVLKNCRYNSELDSTNRFDEYFEETFKKLGETRGGDEEGQLLERLTLLREATGEMEKQYLRNGIAILNLSLLGKM